MTKDINVKGVTKQAEHLSSRPVRPGDKVRVKNTMHFDGRLGTIVPTSGNPEDPWDHYVYLEVSGLDARQIIGVMVDQIEHTDESVPPPSV